MPPIRTKPPKPKDLSVEALVLQPAKIIGGGVAGLVLGYFIVLWSGTDMLAFVTPPKASTETAANRPTPKRPMPRPAPQRQPNAKPNDSTDWESLIPSEVFERPTPQLPPEPSPPPEPKAPNPTPTPVVPKAPVPPPPLIRVEDLPSPLVRGAELRAMFKKISDKGREILKLGTMAKQQDAHNKLIQEVNKEATRKKATFRFRIQDAAEIANGKSDLKIMPPLEMAGIAPCFPQLSKFPLFVRSPSHPEGITKEKILAINKGDYLDLKGTVEVWTRLNDRPGSFLILTACADETNTDYNLYLTDYGVTLSPQ